MGNVNEIKLAVTHKDREKLPSNTWFEPVFGAEDPDLFLADGGQTPATTYSPDKGVVMLHTKSSTRFGRIYGGNFRLNKVPPKARPGSLRSCPMTNLPPARPVAWVRSSRRRSCSRSSLDVSGIDAPKCTLGLAPHEGVVVLTERFEDLSLLAGR